MPCEALRGRVAALENWKGTVDDHLSRLDDDLSEIKITLGQTATKEDVQRVEMQIEKSVNGLLREALNAIPARFASVCAGIMVIATLVTLAITLYRGG